MSATTIFEKGILTLGLLIYINSHECTQISPKDAEEEYKQGLLNDLDMRQAGIEATIQTWLKLIALAYFVYIGYLAISGI